MSLRTICTASVLAGIVLCPGGALAQCPMCRLALASPEGQPLAAALRSGIALLLIAPFAAFAVVAALAIRDQRASANANPDPMDPVADAAPPGPASGTDRRPC